MFNRNVFLMIGMVVGIIFSLISCAAVKKPLTIDERQKISKANGQVELFEKLRTQQIDSFSRQHQYRTKDGAYAWALTTISGVHKDNGELDYVIAVSEDISSQKNLEQQVNQEQTNESSNQA